MTTRQGSVSNAPGKEPPGSDDDTGVLVVAAAGIAAFLCFLPWWRVPVSEDVQKFLNLKEPTFNAFHVTGGVLYFLAVLSAGLVVVGEKMKLLPWSPKALRTAPLLGGGAALLFWLVSLGSGIPEDPTSQQVVHTSWFWIELLATIAVVVSAAKRWKRMQATEASAEG